MSHLRESANADMQTQILLKKRMTSGSVSVVFLASSLKHEMKMQNLPSGDLGSLQVGAIITCIPHRPTL